MEMIMVEQPDRIILATDKAVFRTAHADSLVGLFFHSEVDIVDGRHWQGCVIARPEPGYYLVETFSWMDGTSYTQQLVRIEDMLTWQFYDSAEWMNDAYSSWVHGKWNPERS
jgi:hypothetical protein